jgi:hypothetical protein
MMDSTHTIQSLTDDILKQVEDSEQLEKTAAEAPRELTTPLAAKLLQISTDMRKMASSAADVSYEDIMEFKRKMRS